MQLPPSLHAAPLTGMFIGMILGAVLGVAGVIYLEVEPMLDQFCLVSIGLLAGQLFGAIVGATLGKPPS